MKIRKIESKYSKLLGQQALEKLKIYIPMERGLFSQHNKEVNELIEIISKGLNADQTKTLTLEEVIKEWEELGYKWKEDEIFITLIKQKYHKSIKIHKKLKDYKCYDLFRTPTLLHTNNIALYIHFQEHLLLTKTFRALGWEV